jgi:phage terminase large subunit GpA-like protein
MWCTTRTRPLPDYWEALDDVLLRTFPHPTGAVLKIEAACVDSGGHHTQAVYDFCRPRFSRRVFAIKGIAGPNKPIWPKKATRNVAKKTDVFIIGVDQAKSVMQARLLIAPDGRRWAARATATSRSWTFMMKPILTGSPLRRPHQV